jgi:hypothetical protein
MPTVRDTLPLVRRFVQSITSPHPTLNRKHSRSIILDGPCSSIEDQPLSLSYTELAPGIVVVEAHTILCQLLRREGESLIQAVCITADEEEK